MRVGISVITHAGQNIWENGIGQNVFFLARLLRGLPGVESVILINCGDQETVPPQAATEAAEFPLMRAREATDLIDIVIEMAGALDPEWVDYVRARGKKVAFMACGHPYGRITEPNVFARGGFASRPDRFDEIWILPMFGQYAPMLRTIHRCGVFVTPYIWSPLFLEKSIAAHRGETAAFGFDPACLADGGGLRAAIFEPNISVTKAGVIPMLICDEAYRRVPRSVREVKVLNTLHMVEHTTFNFLANSLEIVRAGKALFLSREEFAPFMAGNADLVVSHQWENDQNYLYLDALYGGYPLVHNSPWLFEYGYYYPGFDVDTGAAQVLAAAASHVDNLVTYAARARSLIAGLDPAAGANREAYARRLLHLWPASGRSAA
jgi:hypothetical protein